MNIELKFPENLTDDEMEKLKNLVEKASVKKSKVFKPGLNGIYYAITAGGEICTCAWDDNTFACTCFDIGNCFETPEEAEFALEKQKVLTGLKRYALKHNECEIDWKSREQDKYCIHYENLSGGSLRICVTNFIANIGQIYFTSQQIAENAIEAIGAERIKKYLFGVE